MNTALKNHIEQEQAEGHITLPQPVHIPAEHIHEAAIASLTSA